MKGHVQFQNLSFHYLDRSKTLNNINIEIAPGKNDRICWPNRFRKKYCGKTYFAIL